MVKQTVRRATAADQALVSQLLKKVNLPTAGIDKFIDHFYLYLENETLCGCIGLEKYGDAGLLRSTAVHPDHQGKGIGELLVGRILSFARKSNVKKVYLLTNTAQNYFKEWNFVEITAADVDPKVQESVEFKGTCPSTAAIMCLDLEKEENEPETPVK